MSVFLSQVSLDEVVARALSTSTADEVSSEVSQDLPLVHTDPVLLERVIQNVVDNARRFSPVGLPVCLRADLIRPEHVRLQISDRGPGVGATDYDSLFVPFQRLGDRSGEGVGLGLAIARGFSEAIGAPLTPSETPDGGLTMTLILPVAP